MKAIRMGQVPDVGWLTNTAILTSFIVGSAAGVLVMWFAGAQVPMDVADVAPLTTQSETLETAALPLDLPSPLADMDLGPADTMQASSSVRQSIVPPARRQVGTSGASSTGPPTKVDTRSRVTPAVGAIPQKAATSSRPLYRGSLAFRSAPQGARVFVNGAFVGSTPLVLDNLPVGSRAVRMEAEGYQRWSSTTQVVANQQTRVSATLGPAIR
jgi:hypothetical protein